MRNCDDPRIQPTGAALRCGRCRWGGDRGSGSRGAGASGGRVPFWLALLLAMTLAVPATAQNAGPAASGSFVVTDTFDAVREAAADPARAAELNAIGWRPEAFRVEWEALPRPAGAAFRLAFAAPRPAAGRGDRALAVEVTWSRAAQSARDPSATGVASKVHSLAKDASGPALVIVHSLAPGQPLARGLANAAATAGVDAFVVSLPGYGSRLPPARRSPGAEAVLSGVGGVADVRRALDVIAALPGIDRERMVLAGISLGSFVASTVSALDGVPVATVSFLGGGSAFEGLRDGAKDAARLREELLRTDHTLATLQALLAPIEPLRFAGRLDPDRVWLVTATADTVIRPANAESFVRAVGEAGLADDHWIRRPGNHYTAAFALPGVAELCIRLARESMPATRSPAPSALSPAVGADAAKAHPAGPAG